MNIQDMVKTLYYASAKMMGALEDVPAFEFKPKAEREAMIAVVERALKVGNGLMSVEDAIAETEEVK